MKVLCAICNREFEGEDVMVTNQEDNKHSANPWSWYNKRDIKCEECIVDLN